MKIFCKLKFSKANSLYSFKILHLDCFVPRNDGQTLNIKL